MHKLRDTQWEKQIRKLNPTFCCQQKTCLRVRVLLSVVKSYLNNNNNNNMQILFAALIFIHNTTTIIQILVTNEFVIGSWLCFLKKNKVK